MDERSNKEQESEKSVGTHKEILYQITKAVQYLHKKGMVHSNINPQSIVICDGDPLVELKPSPKIKLANYEIEGYVVMVMVSILL